MNYISANGLPISLKEGDDGSKLLDILEIIDSGKKGIMLRASNVVLHPNQDGSSTYTISEQNPFFPLSGDFDDSSISLTELDHIVIKAAIVRYEVVQRALANMSTFSLQINELGLSDVAIVFNNRPKRIIVDALALYMRPFSSEGENCYIDKILNLSFIRLSPNFRDWKKNEKLRWKNSVLSGIYSITYNSEIIDSEAILHRFFNLTLFHDKATSKNDNRSMDDILSIFLTMDRCYDFFCDILFRQAGILREILNSYGRVFGISFNDKTLRLPNPLEVPDPDYIITHITGLSRENEGNA